MIWRSSDRYAAIDWRERTIDRRVGVVEYYLLVVGTLAAAATGSFGLGTADTATAFLFAVIVSECVRQAVLLMLQHRAD